MIKNLKNWLTKPPNKRQQRGDKENNGYDPKHHSNISRNRSDRLFPQAPRRVNFHGMRRNSNNYEIDQESDDGGSEVTLTTTANEPTTGRHLYRQQPVVVNPYSVLTEPRRNKGPRSCPGGTQLLDIDEELSSGGGGGNGQVYLDDSPLDTRSEFVPQQRPQHRRSSRHRRAVQPIQQQQPPLRDIGNRAIGRRLSIDDIRHGGHQQTRYKNVPMSMVMQQSSTTDTDDAATNEELAEECAVLRQAYTVERARRKELQRRLKLEGEANERLKLQIETLLFNFGLMARQQQHHQQQQLQQPFPFTAAELLGPTGLGTAALFGASMIGGQNSWTGSTPSSSNAMPTPNRASLWPATTTTGTSNMFPQQLQHHNHNGDGESLASLSMLSGNNQQMLSANFSSILQQHQQHPPPIPPRDSNGMGIGGVAHHQQQKQAQQQLVEDDEVKLYRGTGHTESFSGSSRPTTGELRELEQIKEDLATELSKDNSANFSPESARMARGANTSFMLGLSLSADTIALVVDSPVPPAQQRDDGYATSETNLSSSNLGVAIDDQHVVLQRSKSVG